LDEKDKYPIDYAVNDNLYIQLKKDIENIQ